MPCPGDAFPGGKGAERPKPFRAQVGAAPATLPPLSPLPTSALSRRKRRTATDMARSSGVGVRDYRDHKLELRDDGGTGWTVTVHPPPGSGAPAETLRNHMPLGLNGLLAEARRRVDRRLGETPKKPLLGP